MSRPLAALTVTLRDMLVAAASTACLEEPVGAGTGKRILTVACGCGGDRLSTGSHFGTGSSARLAVQAFALCR